MKRALVLLVFGVAVAPAWAGMTIGFDTFTLNEVLPALTVSELEVPLSETNTIGVIVEDMQVTGLEPGAGAGQALPGRPHHGDVDSPLHLPGLHGARQRPGRNAPAAQPHP